MAVDILILSGVRQGEQIVLDTTNFRVGTSPDCAVFFDPQLDPGAANRSASFCLMEDGWFIVHAMGEILVNHRAVAGPTRIRAGDVVRMSETGPDFSFNMSASAGPARAISFGQDVPKSFTGAITSPVATADGPPALVPVYPRPSDRATVPAHAAATPISAEQNAAKVGINKRLILWVTGGVAVCAVLIIFIRGLGTTTVNVTITAPTTTPFERTGENAKSPDNQSIKDKDASASPITPPTVLHEGASNSTGEPSKSSPPPATSTDEQIAAQLKEAVFLLEVEKSGRFWPIASCCAIGKNTLLTSAREAALLYQERNDPELEWKIWVTNPENKEVKMAVRDIYVNTAYAAMDDKPTDWIYYDFALITVAEELPKIIELASRDELAELEAGMPVYCYGFANEREKITKFDRFQPELARIKIWEISASPNLPLHPRLLQIKGKIFNGAFGSPIVNHNAKIVALYGEAMQPKDMDKIHLTPVIYPEMINLGLKQKDGKTWVSPELHKTSPDRKDGK
jgi:hypothetical protein